MMDEPLPTGRGPMPTEIAAAIINIMGAAKQLGFDEKNPHGGYSYASIDKFLAGLRPLCAKHGLIILLDETECEFRESTRTDDRGQIKTTTYAFLEYAVWLICEGATWGPLTRRLALPATGPQAFGAAESYVLKRFMRNLFQIPTGERDADELPEGNIPQNRSRARQRAEKDWGDQDSGASTQLNARPANGSATALPPHDPETGEIRPVEIPLKMVGEKNDYLSWGQALIAGIKSAGSLDEVGQWRQLNEKGIVAAQGTAAARSVAAAITKATEALQAAEIVSAEEAGSVMG